MGLDIGAEVLVPHVPMLLHLPDHTGGSITQCERSIALMLL